MSSDDITFFNPKIETAANVGIDKRNEIFAEFTY